MRTKHEISSNPIFIPSQVKEFSSFIISALAANPVFYAQKIPGLVHGGSHVSFFPNVQNSWSSCWSLRIFDSRRFVKIIQITDNFVQFFLRLSLLQHQTHFTGCRRLSIPVTPTASLNSPLILRN